MKIKRPSLKGMKNTKYLGHFAQDKYIKKGHNLSGVLPVQEMTTLQPQVSNPFDVQVERQRRQDMINAEAAKVGSSVPDNTASMAVIQRDIDRMRSGKQYRNSEYETDFGKSFSYYGGGSRMQNWQAERALKRAQDELAKQTSKSQATAKSNFLAKNKKFIEEI